MSFHEGCLKRNDLLYPELCYRINGVIFETFKTLGPNQREKYYQFFIARKLKDLNIRCILEKPLFLSIYDKTIRLYADLIVEDKIVIEIKRGSYSKKVYFEQLKKYLFVSKYQLGILAMFGDRRAKIYRVLNIINKNY
ncbi:MAG: GxxExxY protein [Patescibacteria group bacterium]